MPGPTAAAASASPALPAPRLEMLGGFALRCGADEVPLPLGAERLLAYVALHDAPVARGDVAATLWLDVDEAPSSANLRSTLWRLRRSCDDVLEVTQGHLRLAPAVAVDARDSLCLARELVSDDAPIPADSGRQALAVLAADLLPDWYDEWLLFARERWRQLRLHALESLARRLAAGHAYADAIEAALAALDAEPLRESAHSCLIAVHLAEGNRMEARRAYDRLVTLLDSELGVEPSAALTLQLDVASRGAATAR